MDSCYLPPSEVSQEQRARYEEVKESVDKKAEQLARNQLNLKEGEHARFLYRAIWHFKQRILKEEYNIDWHSPEETEPWNCYD
jgi:hypothetical protein